MSIAMYEPLYVCKPVPSTSSCAISGMYHPHGQVFFRIRLPLAVQNASVKLPPR